MNFKPGDRVLFVTCFSRNNLNATVVDWGNLNPPPAVPFAEDIVATLKSGMYTAVLIDDYDNSRWKYSPYYLAPTWFLELR